MGNIDYDQYFRLLNVPYDVSLEELDQRYFELVESCTLQQLHGSKSAKLDLDGVDEAYGAIMRTFLRTAAEPRVTPEKEYSMQQIVNGQERITKPSIVFSDLWGGPVPIRTADPRHQSMEEIEIDLDIPEEHGTPRVPGLVIQQIDGDIKDAPDRAVIVRK
jgi:hypothetical protein